MGLQLSGLLGTVASAVQRPFPGTEAQSLFPLNWGHLSCLALWLGLWPNSSLPNQVAQVGVTGIIWWVL